MTGQYIIKNGRIVLRDTTLEGQCLAVNNGRIQAITAAPGRYRHYKTIDARGHFVTPGFVELHFHGCSRFGFDVDEEDVVEKISKYLHEKGVNTFVPGMADNAHVIERTVRQVERYHGPASIPGIYIEGPFINPEKRGGIQLNHIRPPNLAYLERLIKTCRGRLRLMTIAPEINGNRKVFRLLREQGIVPCLGHSNAELADMEPYNLEGTTSFTHLFNAMSGMGHKRTGLAMLPFLNDTLFFELNSDGVHCSPAIIRLCYRHLNPGRMILISDAVVSAGEAYGEYRYYDKAIVSDTTGVHYKKEGTLVGANCLVPEIARRFMAFTGAPMHAAVACATYNPARLLGMHRTTGSIEVGKRADLVIVDKNFKLVRNLVDD